MSRYYIGVENLFYKQGHPYYSDKNNKMDLIYKGYGAFNRQPTMEDLKCLDQDMLSFGYKSIEGYKFGCKEACGEDFVIADCSTETEAEGLYNSYIKKYYTDRNHPMMIYLGNIFIYTYDDGKMKKVRTLAKGISE